MDSSTVTVQVAPLINPEMDFSFSDGPLPLHQHPAYGMAVAHFGATVQIAQFLKEGKVIGRALLVGRRFLGCIRLTTVFRGPVWRNGISVHDKTVVLANLRSLYLKSRWNFLALLPELPTEEPSQALMKAAGYRPIMTGFSTIWCDLRESKDSLRGRLVGTWRNQLVRAEKSGLTVQMAGPKSQDFEWLLDREDAQRETKGYKAPPLQLVREYIKAGGKNSAVALIARQKKERVAGALFLCHGNSATYHIGWNGADGRRVYAQNLLLWQAIVHLKARDIRWLDLGGLNTDQMAGIARFKLGLGWPPIRLAGSYM